MKKQWPSTIVLHCSATKNGKYLDPKTVDKWHKARKFSKIGYHIMIQPDGEVNHSGNSILRSFTAQGAHVQGGNKNSLGICIVGNDKFTEAQFSALRFEIIGLKQLYNIPFYEVRGHYQYKSAQKQGKTCPNMDINRIIYWVVTNDYKALKPYLRD